MLARQTAPLPPQRKSAKLREQRYDLMQMTLGFWRSQVLFSCTTLGVFDLLHEAPCNAAEVANRCNSSVPHMDRLLSAAVALDLLRRDGDLLENSAMVEEFLVEGAPQSMGRWVRFMADCYQPWGHLSESVKHGVSVRRGAEEIQAESAYTRNLILAMHDYAAGPGRAMVDVLDLSGRERMLDLGGGPGSYSIFLAQRFPQLQATVFDLEPVVAIARDLIRSFGIDDRVHVRAGNYMSDDLGSDYDVVLLSNMLHQEDPEACKAILRRARATLVEGGLMVVQLAFLNPDRSGPPWAVLQGLQLSLLYSGGRTYTVEEISEMLREIGFGELTVKKPSLVSSESLILAIK